MKTAGKLFLIVIILLLIYVLNIFSPKRPILALESKEYDLGNIGHDKIKTVFVKFKNAGNSPLHIKKVITGCNCTQAILSGDKYQPEESGTIQINYHVTEGIGSNVRQKVIIYSNDTRKPYETLILKGKIEPTIVFVPNKIDFGDIIIGSEPEQSIIVAPLGIEEDYEIKSILTNIEQAKITISDANNLDMPSEILKSGNAYKLTYKLPKIVKTGKLKGDLEIKTTCKRAEMLTASVCGNVISSFCFQPKTLFISVKDTPVKEAKVVTIASQFPVEIVPMDSNHIIKCSSMTKPPAKIWLFECFLEGHQSGFETGLLEFEVKGHPYEEKISIPYIIVGGGNAIPPA